MCCLVAGTGRGVEGGGGGLQLQRRRRGRAAAQDTRHLRQVGPLLNHTAYTETASHSHMVGFTGVLSPSCPSLFVSPCRPLGSVVYLMASFETSRATTASLMQRLESAMDTVEQAAGSGAAEGPAAIVI